MLVLPLVDGFQNLWVDTLKWIPAVLFYKPPCFFSLFSLCSLCSASTLRSHKLPPSLRHSLNNSCVSLTPTIFGLIVSSLFGRGIVDFQASVLFPCVSVQEYQMASCATPQVTLHHDGAFVMALTSCLAKERSYFFKHFASPSIVCRFLLPVGFVSSWRTCCSWIYAQPFALVSAVSTAQAVPGLNHANQRFQAQH